MGIERLCVYMGLKWSQDPSPADLVQQNSEVLRAIAKFPERAFGFVYLSAKHPEESLAELERCVANGPMVGVKLWVAERCSVAGHRCDHPARGGIEGGDLSAHLVQNERQLPR
jgi:hypothetical protein